MTTSSSICSGATTPSTLPRRGTRDSAARESRSPSSRFRFGTTDWIDARADTFVEKAAPGAVATTIPTSGVRLERPDDVKLKSLA